uniref:DNA 3'-5' helicase n=1 Tax=Sinocyclocheilus anshuiensis TaxID=1608454 RepID=A0A671S6E9_9TELE
KEAIMGDRTLPEWMNKPQEEHVRKSILEDDLPYLEFGGTVIYSQERHDCSFLSEDLRSGLASGSAVGFDLEWPPSFTKVKKKKVAVVQLCASEEKCYLFHISSMSGFPPGLKGFLEDENIKKVGVGIEGDKWKLLSDYDIKLKNIVELSDLANKTLRCGEKWSLDGLVKHLLKKQLFKDKRVRCSHWDDFGLTEDQKRYAATDAYVSQYKQLQLRNSKWIKLWCDELNAVDVYLAARLVDDLSQTVASLRCVLSNASKPFDPSDEEAKTKPENRDQSHRQSEEDAGRHMQRECVMSLDISEYELQMLEQQARHEQLEEECILAFQVTAAFSCSVLYHIPQPVPEQIKHLKMFFGHHSFKPVQWKVIHSVLTERRDNLVVMATGYGKSLCFQFPPVYCQNVSVVISPLIALMEDQVLHLQMSNIPACFLGSAQTKNLYEEVKRGHFRVVYMTPEFCSGNIPLLAQLDRTVGLSLVAVDEAHCISQWGHDFRSAYRDLWKLKKNLPGVPILALTATASPSIREDIVKSLRLINPLITCTSFDRPNLYLDVNRKSGDVIQDLKQFLIKKKRGGFEFEGSAIVYCPSKKEAERVTAALCKLDIPCGVYHAGLSIKRRRETQHQFMRDEIQCVVATVAFGMGINKSDIRKVIHYGAPKEMESYYQEIGRAGRDGMPSACHVLWVPGDMALNRFILNQSKSERFRDYKMDMMAKMEKYLNSTKCRRKLILCHFEDKRLRKVTSGIMGSSDCCDNCRSGVNREDPEVVLQDFGSCAYQLMKAIRAMDERFGITAPILFLRGSTSQRVPDHFRAHSLFGIGRETSETWWKALSRELVAEKYLMETTGHSKFSTLCKLTPKGRSWLSTAEDERHRRLLLQPNRDLFSRVFEGTLPTQIHANVRAQTPAVSAREIQLQVLNLKHSCFLFLKSNWVISEGRTAVYVSGNNSQYQFFSLFVLFLQSELYGKLVSERQKLAGLRDIPPALLATNKILLDMAKSRPCSISSLKQVDGVSEAKAAMLTPLIEVILTFCQTHGLQVDDSSSSTPPVQTHSSREYSSVGQFLPDSVSVTHRLFQMEYKTMVRHSLLILPFNVASSHLLQAQKMGCAVDTDRAGLSASIYNTIRKSIASPPVNLSDFKAIRSRVPEDVSNFLLRLALYELQREASFTAHHEISWIEPLVCFCHFELQ